MSSPSMPEAGGRGWDRYYERKSAWAPLRALRRRFLDEVLRTLEELLGESRPSSVLEIGSGEGSYLAAVSRRFGAAPHGFELSERGAEECRRTLTEAGLDAGAVVVSNAFDEGLKRQWAGRFDLVCSFGFVEHFEDARKPLSAHEHYLRSGGICFVTMPDFSNPYNRWFCRIAKGAENYRQLAINERITPSALDAAGKAVFSRSVCGAFRTWPVYRPTSLFRAVLAAPMLLLALAANVVRLPIPRFLGPTVFAASWKLSEKLSD